MVDFYSLKEFSDGPHMVADPKGKWAWGADLASARAEIERLKASNEALMRERTSMIQTHRASIKRLIAERDEARAQVAAAYEAAAHLIECDGDALAGKMGAATAIRALTPADARAALEAYGREKAREAMQRAADIVEDYCSDDPMLAGHGYSASIRDAILAEMEALK